MAFQQGPDPSPNLEGPPVSFIRDDSCNEVMFCVSALIGVDALRGIAQRFCDMDNRVVNVAYYPSMNEYRIFHPDTPLANRLEGYNFLYAVTPSGSNTSELAAEDEEINGAEHVPRPKNKWIMYRQEKSREILRERPSLSAGEISKMVAEMWKGESEEVRAFWTQKAKEEEASHKERYPYYQFSTNKTKRGLMKRKASVPHSSDGGQPNKSMKYEKPAVP